MKRVLFVLGLSGSGKSFITTELIKNYPEIFYKLEQYTTRPRRTETENEYYYVSVDHYNLIKDSLMATTVVSNNFYGTIPTLIEGQTAIVIVNALGLSNGIKYVIEHDIPYEIMYVKTDTPFEVRGNRNVDTEEHDIDLLLTQLELSPYNPYETKSSINMFLERTFSSKDRYLVINNNSDCPIAIDDTLVNHICISF